MSAEPTARFNFNFAELAPAEQPLRVLESSALPLPGGAETVVARPRPRWLPRLLPVFRAREPLHIDIRSAAAPPFGRRLSAALASIYATAGSEAAIRVVAWPGGMVVAGHGVQQIPEEAHAVIVVAALERGSVEAARELLRTAPEERAWLVVDGDVPSADAALGVDSLARRVGNGRIVRLPLLGCRELSALARGGEPGMARRSTGRRYLDLASRLVRSYLEQQP
jgi:hypothetical protein